MKQLLSICILFWSIVAYAQHPVYYQLNDEDGLPSNEVYQVLQDKDGFMWIGCEDGLFRFDGNSFKRYRNSFQNGVAVSDLKLDSKNRIWCRNFTGQLYRVDGDSLYTITDVSRTKMASNVFALQPDGFAWIVRNNLLTCYSDQGKILKTIPLNQSGTSVFAAHMMWFDGSVFVSLTSGDVIKVNAQSGKKTILVRSDVTNPTTSTFYTWTKQLFMAKQHNTQGSIEMYSFSNDRFIKQRSFSQGKANARIFHYGVDSDERLWLCTNDGLKPFRMSMKDMDEVKSYFPGKKVSYVFKDREGTTWVSTLQDGIFIIPSFDVIRYNTENCRIPEDNLTALCLSDKTKVFAGSYTGLISEIDLRSGAVVNYQSTVATVSAKDMVCYGDKVLVAHGPLSLLGEGKILAQWPVYQLRDISIRSSMLHYVSSSLSGKVNLEEVKNATKTPYGRYETLGGRSIGVTPKGLVYYGLNSGLFVERNGKRSEIRLYGRQIVASSIAVAGEKVYVATITHGLLLLTDGKVQRNWSRSTDRIADELRLVSLSKQYVWFCSNEVLFRMDLSSGKVDRFGRSHGIIPKGINAIQIVDGQVYMATDKGLIIFPEDLKWKNDIKPLLSIGSVLVDNVPLTSSEKVVVPYNHRSISFLLDAPVLRDNELAEFRYRFAGNQTWSTQPVNRRTLDFNNLSAGYYILQVASVNESGVWSEIVEYRFWVNPPFWQKWWFYAVLILLTACIVALAFMGRISFVRRKAELQNRALNAQLTALKAQMNPHFMYNALNSIQALIIQKDVVNSNLYLGKFSKLMRMILDASGKEYISVREEVEILRLYLELEKLRFGKDFMYTIDVDPTIDDQHLELPSVILQPFVENALKHGLLHKVGEKQLSISFVLNGDLICTIRDNGIGRKRSEEIRQRRLGNHQSFASDAVSRQVELMNAYSGKGIRIEILDLEEKGESTGTEVRVIIPLN